jgi:hypothetical protein
MVMFEVEHFLGSRSGFRKMLSESTSVEESQALRTALLAYCCQDTLAMVEIYRALGALAL